MTANREKYKQRQSDLLEALLGNIGTSLPDGIDENRLAVLRDSLLAKRSASIARRWPNLKRELGENWHKKFIDHALRSTLDFRDDALFDGLRFAREIAAVPISLEATCELVGAELRAGKRYSLRISRNGTVVAGVRIPLLGLKVLAFGRN